MDDDRRVASRGFGDSLVRWAIAHPVSVCVVFACMMVLEGDADGIADAAGEFEWPCFIQSKALKMRRLIAWFWRVAAQSARRPAARR